MRDQNQEGGHQLRANVQVAANMFIPYVSTCFKVSVGNKKKRIEQNETLKNHPHHGRGLVESDGIDPRPISVPEGKLRVSWNRGNPPNHPKLGHFGVEAYRFADP